MDNFVGIILMIFMGLGLLAIVVGKTISMTSGDPDDNSAPDEVKPGKWRSVIIVASVISIVVLFKTCIAD